MVNWIFDGSNLAYESRYGKFELIARPTYCDRGRFLLFTPTDLPITEATRTDVLFIWKLLSTQFYFLPENAGNDIQALINILDTSSLSMPELEIEILNKKVINKFVNYIYLNRDDISNIDKKSWWIDVKARIQAQGLITAYENEDSFLKYYSLNITSFPGVINPLDFDDRFPRFYLSEQTLQSELNEWLNFNNYAIPSFAQA